MGLINFGTNPIGLGSDPGMVKERKAFVTDLRKTFDALNKLGIAKLLSAKTGRAAVKKLTHSLIIIAREVGYPTVLRALAVMNDLASRHAKYMSAAETNRQEFALLQREVKIAFIDIEAGNMKAMRRGVKNLPHAISRNRKAVARTAAMGAWGTLLAMAAAGAGVFIATKSFSSTNNVPLGASPNALLDFFIRMDAGTATADEYSAAARLADSLKLPITAQAIRQNQRLQGMPQNELWPGTKTSVYLYANQYVGQFKAEAEVSANKSAVNNAKAQILSYMIKYARAKLGMPPGSSAPGILDRGATAGAAGLARLPLTARAILSDSSLPVSEMWPGTNVNVDLYIKTYITRMGLIAPPRAPSPGQGVATTSYPLTAAPPPPPPPPPTSRGGTYHF